LLLAAMLLLVGGGGWLLGREVWARYHWRQAVQAAVLRDFPGALSHLACCRSVWPNRAEVYLLCARNARRAGQLDEADDYLHTCRNLDGSTPPVMLERLLLTAQRGDFVSVEDSLRGLFRPNSAEGVLIAEVMSWGLLRANRLQEAREYLDYWLERRPDEVEALVRRGWVNEHLFEFDDSLRDYRRVLVLAPERDPVRLRVAEILLQTLRGTEAVPYLEELRTRRPDDPAVRLCWARCQRRLGRLDEARRTLDDLLADAPDDAQALGERGSLALHEDDTAGAERWLRQARRLAPFDRQINYSLLLCLQRQRKGEEAEEVRRRVEQIDADQTRLRRLFTEVMAHPHNAALRFETAGIFLRHGLRDDALRWLLTAIEVDPRHRPSHEALARYYEDERQAALAAEHRRILERLPTPLATTP
jgi:tetratricopeptide (TPR) repeat protein